MGPRRLPVPDPLFVIGCARSGTTLLADLLGRHTRLVVVPEWPITSGHPIPPDVARGRSLGLSERAKLVPWGVSESEFVAAVADGSVASAMAALVYRYLGHDQAPVYWVDHTPTHVECVPALLDAFPAARFVHMVRDPRAVVASILKVDWGPEAALPAARWWNAEVASGLAAETLNGALRVRYEDLVDDPEREVGRVFAHLALPYEEGGGGGGYSVPDYSRAQHALVGGPLVAARKEAWKFTLTTRDVRRVERETAGLMRLFGYRPVEEPSYQREFGSELRSAGRDSILRVGSRWRRRLRLVRLARPHSDGRS